MTKSEHVVAAPLKNATAGGGVRCECLRCDDWLEIVGRIGVGVPLLTNAMREFEERHAKCPPKEAAA